MLISQASRSVKVKTEGIHDACFQNPHCLSLVYTQRPLPGPWGLL